MAKIKEISVNEFRNRYSNHRMLQEAFATIKNATLVKSNDKSVVILDEESGLFYDADYEIDTDTRQLTLRSFSPFVLKEEAVNVTETYKRAMNVDLNEEESTGLIRKITRHLINTYFGGERAKLIGEAKTKAHSKKVDRARKAVLEDMNVFKSQNRKLISETKADFYDRFVAKLNDKYLTDGQKIVIKEKIPFNLVERRGKSDKIKESVYVKALDAKTEALNEFFNPVDIVRNSPSFIEKLNLFMDNVRTAVVNGKDEKLEESTKAFSTFAKNWPVLYTMSPERHREFAIRHFSATVSDKSRAKEYVGYYNSLSESEMFTADQTKYLKENYSWSTEDLEKVEKTRKLSESSYNAKLLDDAKRAVSKIREKVDRIESLNVENYLKHAEDSMGIMLRSGRFNEELFEQFASDIFGDSALITAEKEEEIFSDPDFKAKKESVKVNEEEIKTYELEAKAHKLVVEIRDLLPKLDKTIRFALEEDFDLLKSMIAINTIEENKINAIETLVNEIKKSTTAAKQDALSEEKKEAWCVVCGSEVTKEVNEALSAGRKSMPCPSCQKEMTLAR